jgi:hypothetical protein
LEALCCTTTLSKLSGNRAKVTKRKGARDEGMGSATSPKDVGERASPARV